MNAISFFSFAVCACVGFFGLAQGSCPDGYCRHSRGCYLVVDLQVSWLDARGYCSVLGGSLFAPTTETMQTSVEGALRKSKGTIKPGRFWIDITDLLNPKDWKRMSSRTSLTYSNWYDGWSNSTNGNCVAMDESQNYQWSSYYCSKKLNFICYASGELKQIRVQDQRYHYDYRYKMEDPLDDPQC